MRRSAAPLLALIGLLAPTGARAADPEPIMPLAQVQPGMRCQAATVVRGTDIATFDVDIVDVVAGDAAAQSPYILFRASGPAVDATGIGPGFSGSPIRCPAADGTMEIAGAISEGIGAYGGLEALATPIESVLGQPVHPPASVRTAPTLMARARPIAEPLSFGGLAPPVATVLQAAAKRAGRVVYATPAAPRGLAFPPQPLVPGAAVAVGLASGDITAGAIGTVTYARGDDVWAFGHPLDAAGARSLFLEDAYVYDVIGNPIGSSDLSTYKYAAAGHDLGTLSSDGINAVAGTLGALPPSYPLTLTAKDLDAGRVQQAHVKIADESALGNPAGTTSLAEVGSVGVAELAYEILQGAPVRQSGRMCVKISLAGRPKPLGFCNTYVGSDGATALGGGPLVSDFANAADQLQDFHFGPLHITGVTVDIALRRDLRQAFLLSARGPRTARRGARVPVRLSFRRVDGAKATRTVRVQVPRSLKRGAHSLRFAGTAEDVAGNPEDAMTTVIDLGSLLDGSSAPAEGPRTLDDLAAAIAAVHRRDGVTASFGGGKGAQVVYRSPRGELRLSGSTTLPLTLR